MGVGRASGKLWSERGRRIEESPISAMMAQALAEPGLISLAAGFVDYSTLPVEEVRRALEGMLADDSAARAALQYGTTKGLPSLRERLARRIARLDGVPYGTRGYSADNVIIGTGSQQLLYLLTEVLLAPGDIVILGHPSYFVFMDALKAGGASCRSVPLDDEGMRADLLEKLLGSMKKRGELGRVRMLYLVSYYENPTGISLSARRRRAIWRLVKKYFAGERMHVVEDAAYRELRYAGRDVASLRSLDRSGKRSISLGTFSKSLSPGLKTGYGLFPPDVAAKVEHLKGAHDFGSNNFTQHLLDRLLADGSYDRHVRRLRAGYRRKLLATTEAIDRWRPPGVRRTDPTGGLYVWLTLPEGVDAGPGSPLFHAALRRHVIYVPGEFCFAPGSDGPVPANSIRLSFGVGNVARIREGVRRLAEAVKECLT